MKNFMFSIFHGMIGAAIVYLIIIPALKYWAQ